MEVSVIIPTYNGAKKIPCVLDALLLQTIKNFELIVVIDGSTDNTYEILEKYATKFPNLKIIKQENKGRAAVRNRGAYAATYNLLIFYDDDMEPVEDSMERHYEFHKNNFDAILGGDQIDLTSFLKTDIQNYKAHNYRKWTKHFNEGLNLVTNKRPFLTAANMSVKKELFIKLGGFDSRLTDIEDLEFVKRALRQNVTVFFDKSNKAIHHDPITCKSYIKRVKQYNLAQQYLHTIFPNDFPDRTTQRKLKKLFYRFFAFRFWVYLIDHTSCLRILPTFIRYKIYEWVIYSRGVVFNDIEI